jgi:hypothetical protein
MGQCSWAMAVLKPDNGAYGTVLCLGFSAGDVLTPAVF